jgi:cytochrome c biogenesis protein CcmG, thiol:disulfide interchange protein DsbE
MGLDENRGTRQMKRGESQIIQYRFVLSAVASITGLMAGLYGSAVTWAQHERTTPAAAPAIGAQAVDFELKLLDGKSIRLEQLRGKPVVINFFASWCDPCRDEMPLINKIAAGGDKRGYRVIGIAVEDTRAAVMQFSKEAKLAFPVGLDLNSAIKRAYRIFGPPATFFIDAQGTVRDIVLGPVTPERARQALNKSGVL